VSVKPEIASEVNSLLAGVRTNVDGIGVIQANMDKLATAARYIEKVKFYPGVGEAFSDYHDNVTAFCVRTAEFLGEQDGVDIPPNGLDRVKACTNQTLTALDKMSELSPGDPWEDLFIGLVAAIKAVIHSAAETAVEAVEVVSPILVPVLVIVIGVAAAVIYFKSQVS
jgi:hypothetical protein